MERSDLSAGALAYLLNTRDSGFAFDELRRLAIAPSRPDLTQAERALVERGDDLADLAVGAFGRDAEAVKAVYARAKTLQIRAAVLGNADVEAHGWGNTVLSLSQAEALLTEGEPELLHALLCNCALAPDALLSIFEKSGAATGLSDHLWPIIFQALCHNDCLGELFDTRRTLPAASARAMMNEAFFHRLLQIAPTLEIADSLGPLLEALNDGLAPNTCFETPLFEDMVQRWHPSAQSDASANPYFRVIMLLTILCHQQGDSHPESHPFIAVRAGAMALQYVGAPSDLERLKLKDGAAFSAGMPFNRHLYDSSFLGSAFADMSTYQDETALALYLHRRKKLDQLWGANEPITQRDLDRLYEIATGTTQSPNTLSSADIEQIFSAQMEAWRRDAKSNRTWWEWPPTWRSFAIFLVVIIALLLVFQIIEIEVLKGHINFSK